MHSLKHLFRQHSTFVFAEGRTWKIMVCVSPCACLRVFPPCGDFFKTLQCSRTSGGTAGERPAVQWMPYGEDVRKYEGGGARIGSTWARRDNWRELIRCNQRPPSAGTGQVVSQVFHTRTTTYYCMFCIPPVCGAALYTPARGDRTPSRYSRVCIVTPAECAASFIYLQDVCHGNIIFGVATQRR